MFGKGCRYILSIEITWLWVALLFSALAPLAIALYYEHVLEVVPCEICYYERIPYYLLLLLSCIAMFLTWSPHKKRTKRETEKETNFLKPQHQCALLCLAALLCVCGVGISLFHVSVEQHWIEHNCSVSNGVPLTDDMDEYYAMLEAVETPPCSVVQLSFLGISMSMWGVIYCFALFVALLLYVVQYYIYHVKKERDHHR